MQKHHFHFPQHLPEPQNGRGAEKDHNDHPAPQNPHTPSQPPTASDLARSPPSPPRSFLEPRTAPLPVPGPFSRTPPAQLSSALAPVAPRLPSRCCPDSSGCRRAVLRGGPGGRSGALRGEPRLRQPAPNARSRARRLGQRQPAELPRTKETAGAGRRRRCPIRGRGRGKGDAAQGELLLPQRDDDRSARPAPRSGARNGHGRRREALGSSRGFEMHQKALKSITKPQPGSSGLSRAASRMLNIICYHTRW